MRQATSDEDGSCKQTDVKLRSREIVCHIVLIFWGLILKIKCVIAEFLVKLSRQRDGPPFTTSMRLAMPFYVDELFTRDNGWPTLRTVVSFSIIWTLKYWDATVSQARNQQKQVASSTYIRTIAASVQLENNVTCRESEGACRRDELIGGKPPVVKKIWLECSGSAVGGCFRTSVVPGTSLRMRHHTRICIDVDCNIIITKLLDRHTLGT
jgi:hypothetical protein